MHLHWRPSVRARQVQKLTQACWLPFLSVATGPASPAPRQPRSVRDFFDATNGCLQQLVAAPWLSRMPGGSRFPKFCVPCASPQESNSKAEAAKSLSTLAMVLLNLLKDPSSEKNRKVNTSSSRFSEIFRNNSAAAKLLQLAGFSFQHPNFVFGDQQESNTEDAQRTLELVQDAQRNLDQTWASRAPTNAVPAEEPRAVASGEAPVPGAAAAASASSTSAPAAPAAPAAARPWARPSAAQQWASQARDIQSEEAAQASSASSGLPGPTPAQPAHPAETLPPAIAHPAEAPGPSAPAAPVPHLPNPTPPLLTGPPMQQQHMHLPIAHPAQAAAVKVSVDSSCLSMFQPCLSNTAVWATRKMLLFTGSFLFEHDKAKEFRLLWFVDLRKERSCLFWERLVVPSLTSHKCRRNGYIASCGYL